MKQFAEKSFGRQSKRRQRKIVYQTGSGSNWGSILQKGVK